jgi:hypothetical protein
VSYALSHVRLWPSTWKEFLDWIPNDKWHRIKAAHAGKGSATLQTFVPYEARGEGFANGSVLFAEGDITFRGMGDVYSVDATFHAVTGRTILINNYLDQQAGTSAASQTFGGFRDAAMDVVGSPDVRGNQLGVRVTLHRQLPSDPIFREQVFDMIRDLCRKFWITHLGTIAYLWASFGAGGSADGVNTFLWWKRIREQPDATVIDWVMRQLRPMLREPEGRSVRIALGKERAPKPVDVVNAPIDEIDYGIHPENVLHDLHRWRMWFTRSSHHHEKAVRQGLLFIVLQDLAALCIERGVASRGGASGVIDLV